MEFLLDVNLALASFFGEIFRGKLSSTNENQGSQKSRSDIYEYDVNRISSLTPSIQPDFDILDSRLY